MVDTIDKKVAVGCGVSRLMGYVSLKNCCIFTVLIVITGLKILWGFLKTVLFCCRLKLKGIFNKTKGFTASKTVSML